MPGPIETAYVEIVARLEVGTLEDELADAVRRAVNQATPAFKRLEKAGVDTAKSIGDTFRRIDLALDVRQAVRDLAKVEDRALDVFHAVERLDEDNVRLDATAALAQLNLLEASMTDLTRRIRSLDDETIDPDFQALETDLRQVLLQTDRLLTAVNDFDDLPITVNTSDAVQKLIRLGEQVGETLRDVERLDGQVIDMKVEDIQIEGLINDLERAQREVRQLDGLHPRITMPTDQVNEYTRRVSAAHKATLDFGRIGGVFSRLVEFTVLRQSAQAIAGLFREGIAAAGAIQTVQVSLNRFFAQTRDLGQSSSEFFGNLRNLALATPFQFADLAETSRRILAMGVNADEALDIMESLGDAVAAVGGGKDDINGVVKALSQLSSKGRVDLQDLRQISERLPSLSRQMQIQGVIDQLNELHPGLNATRADFEDLRKSGLITGEVLRDGIVKAIKEIPGVAGAARAAARTLQGSLSNLADFAKFEFADAFSGLGRILADSLNEAFSTANGEVAVGSLGDAFRTVIQSAGKAGEAALPAGIQAIIDIAPDIADLVTSLGELAAAAAPVLENFGSGALEAFTGASEAVHVLVDALALLPDGFQQGLAQFLLMARIIGPAREALVAPFVAMGRALLVAGNAADFARAKTQLLIATIKGLAAATGLIIIIGVLDEFAKKAKNMREFTEGITAATTSLQQFQDTGEAALDFLAQFAGRGSEVKTGGFFDGVTSFEISDDLGITTRELGDLLEQMAKFDVTLGNKGAGFVGAMALAGINIDEVGDASKETLVSLLVLSEQFAEGAKTAFAAALSSKEFALVEDKVAEAIAREAKRTGDYAGAKERLIAANEEAAKAAFKELSASSLTVSAQQEIINNNTTLETTTDGATRAVIDWAGALGDLRAEMQQDLDVFQLLSDEFDGFDAAFSKLASGTNDLGAGFIDFALRAKEAGFAADEFNAVANKLGDSLGQVFSGAELQKVAEAIVTQVGEFKTALESVVPTIADLQFEADGFSLDGFIAELNRIAEARKNVIANIKGVLDKFGELGADAVRILSTSGLSKDQFAIAIEQAFAGGEDTIRELISSAAVVGHDELEKLAQVLVAAGLKPEKVNEILGVDAFQTAGNEIVNTVAGLSERIAEKLPKLTDFSDTLSTLGQIAGTGGFGPTPTPQVPGVDVSAATEAATTAGDTVGKAFAASVQDSLGGDLAISGTQIAAGLKAAGESAISAVTPVLGVAAGKMGEVVGVAFTVGFEKGTKGVVPALAAVAIRMALFSSELEKVAADVGEKAMFAFSENFDNLDGAVIDEMEQAVSRFNDYVDDFGNIARRIGVESTKQFHIALNFGGAISAAVVTAASVFASTGLRALAYNLGLSIGIDFARGLAAGIRAVTPAVAQAAASATAGAATAARTQSKASSPSKVFADIGKDLSLGLALGIDQQAAAVAAAAADAVAGAAQSVEASPGVTLADGLKGVLNLLIDRINAAFRLLAGAIGAGQVFAGSPVPQFAKGVIATRPTLGVFGERTPEALVPLGDGAAAARIIAGLTPYIGDRGRQAAAELFAPTGTIVSGDGVHTVMHNTFPITMPTADPDLAARKIAARLERRMTK